VRGGQQRVRLDRERARRRLHIPAARDAPELRGERPAPRRRHVLDHAVAVGEVEFAVGERQALRGVRDHQRAGVAEPRLEIDARDVELGRQPAQAQRAAADVDDSRPRARGEELGEAGVAARPRAARERLGQPRQRPTGGRVDLGSGHARRA
jgi:hypothetical protein